MGLTNSRNTNDSIRVGLHAKQDQDFLHIIQALLSSEVCGLSKKSAELQCLPNSRRWKVDILLLDVASFSLERVIPG